jgi:hypothetical protein
MENQTRLAEYDLQLPPPVFRAETLSGDVSNIYSGAAEFTRDELIAKIEAQHGAFGEGVDRARLGFWRAAVSNSSLDSYFTRMGKSSLRNYAMDATNPTVSFQNSHRHNELPVGRSVIGQFVESGNVPQGMNAADFFPTVIVDFYSNRDLKLGDVSVEQFLLGVESHVIKDVSIGFKEGENFQYTCSICNENYWSYECRHVAGVEYAVSDNPNADPTDATTERKLCFVWIENARLSEVSAVYDGATTNAMIIKAEREVRAGRLDNATRTFLERRFRFRADSKTWIAGHKPDESEISETENSNNREVKNSMSEQNPQGGGNAAVVNHEPAIRALAKQMNIEGAETASIEIVLDRVGSTFAATQAKATNFDTFRDAEIESVVAERIAAEGDTFDAEGQKTFRAMLSNCDVSMIREFGKTYKVKADARFPNGRQSGEGAADATETGGAADAGNTDADDKTRSNTGDDSEIPSVLRTMSPHKLRGGV